MCTHRNFNTSEDMAASNSGNDCACVGSMGLHQNNIEAQNDSNLARLGLALTHLGNRSVIDVFREMRDRYFGKPEIQPRLERTNSCSQEMCDDDCTTANINTLPLYCKLMILSMLDTCDICNVSRVNGSWREVANDQILWRELLIRDMCKWSSMTNKSHPLLPHMWNVEVLDSKAEVDFSKLFHKQTPVEDEVKRHSQEQDGMQLEDAPTELQKPNVKSHSINFKALYIHSAFQRRQDDIDTPASNLSIPGFIKSLWNGAADDQGEVIMTGPGMDSPRTSLIFRSLMWGSEFLQTKGLLPGNRDGIGSGVQVMFKEKISFKLIAMYSGNVRIRERRYGMNRLLHSHVVEAVPIASLNQEASETSGNVSNGEHEFVLHDTVRLYLAERNGAYKMIYVIDATADQKWDDVSCNRLELAAILKGTEIDPNVSAVLQNAGDPEVIENAQDYNDQGAPSPSTGKMGVPKRPLLVLSCVPSTDDARIPCVQITSMLGLPDITDRAWRVQDVTVSTMVGVEKGLEWLLRQP